MYTATQQALLEMCLGMGFPVGMGRGMGMISVGVGMLENGM